MSTPVVLMAEDNEWDARVTQEALEAAGLPLQVDHVGDGEAALAYLEERLASGAPLPVLMLLDLNLPRKDGREVLRELKADARLRRIPVIVLTTSMAPADIHKAYDLHANAYLHKPMDPDDYGPIVKAIREFWLDRTVRPDKGG